MGKISKGSQKVHTSGYKRTSHRDVTYSTVIIVNNTESEDSQEGGNSRGIPGLGQRKQIEDRDPVLSLLVPLSGKALNRGES